VGGVPDILTLEWSGPVEARTFRSSERPRGLLVEGRDPEAFAAALELLLLEPSRRQALVEEGLGYVHRCHDLDRLVDDVEAVYRWVLEHPRRRRYGPSSTGERSSS